MAVTLNETFTVDAPIDRVWSFMMNPETVVTCMPGAELENIEDERTFLGKVSVKVGAVTTSYQGRVEFTSVDDVAHLVEMTAEGRETGGGTAKGTMSSRLRELEAGVTEVVAEASVDLTGRGMQMGRGMIQGVSQQLFQEFVACATSQLETPEGEAPPPVENRPIAIIPLFFRTLWAAIVGFVRRLFRRGGDDG